MFSGSAYLVLSREFVEQLHKNPEAKALLEWAKDTDEHNGATLQRMPSLPGSNPPNNLYDTSDLTAIARLVKWNHLVGDVVSSAEQRQQVYVNIQMPKDHTVWSVFHLIYCNPCCLGLIAFWYSIKSRDRLIAGDFEGARRYGSTAKMFNAVSVVIFLLLIIGLLVGFFYVLPMAMRLRY
ncbi:hypothetical protein ACEWY4_015410 [Coilia grayii]|uniref:Uncharacterized protein n=1 Tax=Coilia grayii TaxID=363190 RepID=A0ABD1JMY3_9TELE